MTCQTCGKPTERHAEAKYCITYANLRAARRRASSNRMNYRGMILGYLGDGERNAQKQRLGRWEFGRVLSGVNV